MFILRVWRTFFKPYVLYRGHPAQLLTLVWASLPCSETGAVSATELGLLHSTQRMMTMTWRQWRRHKITTKNTFFHYLQHKSLKSEQHVNLCSIWMSNQRRGHEAQLYIHGIYSAVHTEVVARLIKTWSQNKGTQKFKKHKNPSFTLLYFPAHKTHHDFFVRNFIKKKIMMKVF